MNEEQRRDAWARSWDAGPFLTDDELQAQDEADRVFELRAREGMVAPPSRGVAGASGDSTYPCPVCGRDSHGLCPRCEQWAWGDGR